MIFYKKPEQHASTTFDAAGSAETFFALLCATHAYNRTHVYYSSIRLRYRFWEFTVSVSILSRHKHQHRPHMKGFLHEPFCLLLMSYPYFHQPPQQLPNHLIPIILSPTQWKNTTILLMAEIPHQLRLVVYPIIYDRFYTSNRWLGLGFLNHQQYHSKINQSSGQISIIPKRELREFWGNSLLNPPFKVTHRRKRSL